VNNVCTNDILDMNGNVLSDIAIQSVPYIKSKLILFLLPSNGGDKVVSNDRVVILLVVRR